MSDPVGFQSTFARYSRALELRREGKSYKEIADRLGLKSETSAQTLISKAIKRVLRSTAEEVRQLELDRIELLIKAVWEPAVKELTEVGSHTMTRFDRLRQLIEMKLKYCGAVPGGNEVTDKRVQIYINQYTHNSAQAVQLFPPPDVIDDELTKLNEAVSAHEN